MISDRYRHIKTIVETKFSDIVMAAELILGVAGRIRKLRLYLIDNTFVDIWYSSDGSYSYHGEQRTIRNTTYRHDKLLMRNGETLRLFPSTAMTARS
jgi:hypothetical protein